jgi:hypothetical protein
LQLDHLLADRLVGGVAERALGGRVEVDDPAGHVDSDHGVEGTLEHRHVARLLGPQCLRVAPAFDRLAHLVAERGERRQEVLVDRARLGREELEYAEYPARAADREGDGALLAISARGKLSSSMTSAIQAGLPVSHERPGRPSPAVNRIARLTRPNSSRPGPPSCQTSVQRSASMASDDASQTAPYGQPMLTPIAASARARAARGSAVPARLRATACSVLGSVAIPEIML